MFQLSERRRVAVSHWHRFSRKGYSAFCSIGRVVTIGVLGVSMLASAQPVQPEVSLMADSAAFVDNDASDDPAALSVALGQVEVNATMTSLSAGRKPRVVAVITRRDIEGSPVNSVSDVLKLAARVDVRQRAGFGVQSDISIDGGTADQVTILLNGVNITSPQIGHYSSDWPVDIDDIVRIEVLEGAASRIAGGSSLLGVINIVTRPNRGNNLVVSAGAGSFATADAAARLSITTGNVNHLASGGYIRSDGGTINSAFTRGRAYYSGIWSTSNFDIDWQAGFSDLDHGANTFYSAAYPNQHDHITRYVVSASARTKGRFRVEPQVYWHRLLDHYELIHNSPKGENHHRTDVAGGRLNAYADWYAGTTTIGAEIRHEAILSTNIGLPLDQNLQVPAPDGAVYDHKYSRTNTNIYLEHNIALGPLDISAGLVAASNSQYRSGRFRVYPGIDASLRLDHRWRILASWSNAFRMPTFTDLFYKSPTHQGNRDLKPELMRSLQLSAIFDREPCRLNIALFYHHGHNLLDWVMYTPDDLYHAAAFDLDNFGASANVDIDFPTLLGTRQPLRRLSLGYTYIYQNRLDDKPVFKSNYALEYLRHKFTAQLTHTIAPHLQATWSLRWQKRCGSYIVYLHGQNTGQIQPYSPYATLNLKLTYTLKRWQFSAEATNITNHRYYDLGNVPQPGICILAAAKYTLDNW